MANNNEGNKQYKIVLPLICTLPKSVDNEIENMADWLSTRCRDFHRGFVGEVFPDVPTECPVSLFECPLMQGKERRTYDACEGASFDDWEKVLRKHLVCEVVESEAADEEGK